MCSYTVANIVTNEENGRNVKFALQFAKMIGLAWENDTL